MTKEIAYTCNRVKVKAFLSGQRPEEPEQPSKTTGTLQSPPGMDLASLHGKRNNGVPGGFLTQTVETRARFPQVPGGHFMISTEKSKATLTFRAMPTRIPVVHAGKRRQHRQRRRKRNYDGNIRRRQQMMTSVAKDDGKKTSADDGNNNSERRERQ